MLLTEAARAGVPRIVLASTLDLMEAYPPGWRVDETWRPRPGTAIGELGPYVAELSARELALDLPLLVVCLRLGRLAGDGALAPAAPPDPRRLHPDDAAQAVERALTYDPATRPGQGPPGAAGRPAGQPGGGAPGRRPGQGWWVFHIPGGAHARFPLAAAGLPGFGYVPRHDFGGVAAPEPRQATVNARGVLEPAATTAPAAAAASSGLLRSTASAARSGAAAPRPRPIRRVALFGGSGPLAAAAIPELAPSHMLRVTDILPPEDGAARVAQRFPHAPRPSAVPPPHEFRRVDVSDGAAVLAAAAGMDALVNCSVLREELVAAFRVNLLGAYNVLRAAVAHDIRRVVHTGPQILNFAHPAGHAADFDVPDEVPPRPGANVYFHTKFLALEVCRTFAHNHGLEVAALLFSSFAGRGAAPSRRLGPAPVSWKDAGRALRRAVEVPALPSPFEAMRIIGDVPHGKYSNAKARRVLGWAPRDLLIHLWSDT